MMQCPSCDKTLVAGATMCSCGWRSPVYTEVKRYQGPRRPNETAELIAARDRCMASIRKLSFNKPGNRDWAYKLMARHEAGEILEPNQLQLASEAVRTDPNRNEKRKAA